MQLPKVNKNRGKIKSGANGIKEVTFSMADSCQCMAKTTTIL